MPAPILQCNYQIMRLVPAIIRQYQKMFSLYKNYAAGLILGRLPGKVPGYAAFYPVIFSFKVTFKCNIYDYKPFLNHTESIIH